MTSRATNAPAVSPSTNPPAVPPRPAGTSPLTASQGQIVRKVQPGDTVMVLLDTGVLRPLIVSRIGPATVSPPMAKEAVMEERISGTLFCEPEDHTTTALRTIGMGQTFDPARFHGRPDRLSPVVYAEHLGQGTQIGQWRFR